MKKVILLVALATVLINCYCQENKGKADAKKQVNIPQAVKSSFLKEFPKAENAKWEEEKTGEFEAEFVIGKVEMSANFDVNGNLLETESEISETGLPQLIKATLSKDFTGYKIKEVGKTDAKGVVTYEMEAKKDGKEYELVFDCNGKLLKQKEEKEEEKDEN
jgi:hypothetical protein